MQDFDVSLDPGQTRQIHIQADYIYYRAGSAGGADPSLEFAPLQGGESVFLYPGQSYRLPQRMQGMGAAWMMKNRKGEAKIIGSVLLGEGAFQDNRISGSVEVVDGGKNRTMAGQAFMGGAAIVAAAGNFPHVQLFNPSAMKRVVVKSMYLFAKVTGQVNVRGASAALATLGGNASSKMIDGLASTAEMRSGEAAAAIGGPLMSFPTVTELPLLFKFEEPVVLAQGKGLIVQGAATGQYIGASFEFIEELI